MDARSLVLVAQDSANVVSDSVFTLQVEDDDTLSDTISLRDVVGCAKVTNSLVSDDPSVQRGSTFFWTRVDDIRTMVVGFTFQSDE